MKKIIALIFVITLLILPKNVFGIFSVGSIANIRDNVNETNVSNSTAFSEGLGHATYCPVMSTSSTRAIFPQEVGQVSGKTFKFEPITINNIKNSYANVNLNTLVTRVETTTTALETAYRNYVIAKAEEDAKNCYWNTFKANGFRALTAQQAATCSGGASNPNRERPVRVGSCSQRISSTKDYPYILGCSNTRFATTHSLPWGSSTTLENFYILTKEHPKYNSSMIRGYSNTGYMFGITPAGYYRFKINNHNDLTYNMVEFQPPNIGIISPANKKDRITYTLGWYGNGNRLGVLIPISDRVAMDNEVSTFGSYTCSYLQRVIERRVFGIISMPEKVYNYAEMWRTYPGTLTDGFKRFSYEYEFPSPSYTGVGSYEAPDLMLGGYPRPFTYRTSSTSTRTIYEAVRPKTGCAYPSAPGKTAIFSTGGTIYIDTDRTVNYTETFLMAPGGGVNEVRTESYGSGYVKSYSSTGLPTGTVNVTVRHDDRAENNDPRICTTTTYEDIGNRYDWKYSWRNPVTGVSNTVSVSGTCAETTANFNGTILTQTIINALSTAWTNYNNAMNDLRSCSNWNASFNTDPILSIHTQEGTVRTDYTTTNGRLQRIKEPVVSNSTTTCDPTRSSHCNTDLKVYQRTVNNGVVTITYQGISDKRFQITRKDQVSTETTRFQLANNLNRYIYTDTGEIRNSVDATRLASGMYIDTGSPNFVTGVCTPTVRDGTITLTYRNLGVTGRLFDSNLRTHITNTIPLARRSEYMNATNFLYSSRYLLDTRLCPEGDIAVYRPIKITNPFMGETGASRTPGSNWNNTNDISRFITSSRGAPNGDVYQLTPLYVIDFTGANKTYLSRIKEYNRSNNYNFTPNSVKCTGKDGTLNSGTECRSTYLKTLMDAGVVTGCGTSSNWNACVGVR